MGRPERELRCRKHPKHMQSKGVCPSCLKDKLSNLHTSSSSVTTIAYSSSSSSYSSEDDDDEEEEDEEDEDESELSSSAVSSPDHRYSKIRKNMPQLSGTKSSRWPRLMAKSRSFGFVARDDQNEEKSKDEKKKKEKKKKESFWSKLIVGGSSWMRKESGGGGGVRLFHSKTMKERSSLRWVSVT